MLDELFTQLTLAMDAGFDVALAAAFGWGVLSIILSPCHLSSIPLVIGYIGMQAPKGTGRPFGLSLVFALGILVTIGLVGVATAAAGRMMGDVGFWGNVVVAAVFFVVGLYLLGIIDLSWGRFMPKTTLARGWKGALLLGFVFGIGLGPCTFAFMAPVLSVAFGMASSHPVQAALLIMAFGTGHCAVIVAAGGAVGTVQRYLNWTEESRGAMMLRRGAGVLVLLAGVYFVSTSF
jgi:cytochrome c-type biogenesis protein